eukprot:470032_1
MCDNTTEIIRSRETQNDTNEPHTNMDTLPNVLISSISSFLTFTDILNLEKCNRSIFIGTRSPISIQKIDSITIGRCIKYSDEYQRESNWNRFKSITEISINIHDCFEFKQDSAYDYYDYVGADYQKLTPIHQHKLKHLPIWSNLKTLNIYWDTNNWEYNAHSDYVKVFSDFMLDLKTCDISNVSKVCAKADLLSDENEFADINEFLDIFPSLQYVDFALIPPNNFGFKHLKWPLRIKGMAVDRDDIILSNVLKTNTMLESFYKPNGFVIPIDAQLNNLKEISLRDAVKSDIDMLLSKDLKYLQRIYLKYRRRSGDDIKTDEIKSIELLYKLKSLNCIHICGDNDIVHLMIKILCNVFNDNKNVLGNRCIKIKFEKYGILTKEITECLLNLVNILNKNVSHFMIIWVICDDLNFNSSLVFKDMIEKQKEHLTIDWIKHSKFVISNKGCNISGYKERWLL